MTELEIVEKFQCPGCVCGGDTKCGSYKTEDSFGFVCRGHVLGTFCVPIGSFALGLPRGFNRPGFEDVFPSDGDGHRNRLTMRLWKSGTQPEWNQLNVAVWAMEYEGFLLVRTYSPRVNFTVVDVIEGGTLDLVPNAIDVGKFCDEID